MAILSQKTQGKGIKKWTVPKAFGMKTRHEEYLSSALIPTSLANGNGSVQKSINIKKKKKRKPIRTWPTYLVINLP